MDEQVAHPAHYKGRGIEAIDVIDAFGLDFYLGNVLKYILRAGRKNGQPASRDLGKAAFYLERAIAIEKKKEGVQ